MGELLYCYERGSTSCCFIEEECVPDDLWYKNSSNTLGWFKLNNEMTQKSVDFILKPESFLGNLVSIAGYDTCHRTAEYDASECHKDCQRSEKGTFANQCRKDGGLYKCCIRWVIVSFDKGPGPDLDWNEILYIIIISAWEKNGEVVFRCLATCPTMSQLNS